MHIYRYINITIAKPPVGVDTPQPEYPRRRSNVVKTSLFSRLQLKNTQYILWVGMGLKYLPKNLTKKSHKKTTSFLVVVCSVFVPLVARSVFVRLLTKP